MESKIYRPRPAIVFSAGAKHRILTNKAGAGSRGFATGANMSDTADDTPNVARADFLKQLAALIATSQLPGIAVSSVTNAPRSVPVAPPNNLVGIQMGPHTMLDEGIEHALDVCQETASIDTIFTYCHSYGGDVRKPLSWLATDHGAAVIDQRTRKLPNVWVKQHDQYYKNTSLRHPKVDSTFAYHDRDLFAEMVKPLRARKMKVYPRILEAGGRGIENFSKVVTVNVYGKPTTTGCWNHPEYKAFWNATVEDLFRSYDVDGFQWGAERASPLTNVIQNGNENSASCFCQFCRARGKAHGIDAERARKGFEDLLLYVQGMRAGTLKPADGAAAAFLRILLRSPEVLAWDYQYRLSREEIMKGMYDTIKSIKPSAPVGWHVDHWATSMDIVARAAMSYAEMAPWSDYLKVVVYHAVTAPRMHTWIANEQRSILSDMPLEDAINLHYALFGYDKSLDVADNKPTPTTGSPEYVSRETTRSVASAEGKTRIYPGVGFNLPGGGPDDPETIYQCVMRSAAAGARGVVASREYEEMTVPNLKAVGRAVRELRKTTG